MQGTKEEGNGKERTGADRSRDERIRDGKTLRKELKAKRRMKLGTSLCLIFLLLYIPSLINWMYGENISTAIIRNGTLEESINKNAYIIRNENELVSQFAGRYMPEAAEGDRVPANFRVATVLNQSSEKLLAALREKETAIIKEQNKKKDNMELFSDDIIKLDDRIGERVKQVALLSNSNSLKTLDSLKEEINAIIEKKSEVLGGLNTTDAYVNVLKKEKQTIEDQIKANTRDIITATPGIVSFHVDGLEQILSPKAIKQLTPDMLEKAAASAATRLQPENTAAVNKPFAKIITGNDYYIIAVLDAGEASRFNANDTIAVRLTDINKVIYDCRIDYKSENMNGKYIIAVKLDKYLSDTAGLRTINVDLIKSFYEGLKVPLKSLKDVNISEKTAKIVLVKANFASIRDVRIVGSNSEFCIIKSMEGDVKKGVSLYDSYAVNPENIEEGQVITR